MADEISYEETGKNEEPREEPKQVERKDLNLQRFMDDMQTIGNQVRDNKLRKPAFHYGDLGVTNYLLWLMLAELMILNNKEDKNGS